MREHYMDVVRAYNVEVDINVHTASEEHKSKVIQIFKQLIKSGDLYEGLHEGYFSPKEDVYYTKHQLVGGKSPNGFDIQRVAEKAFFFKLSKYRSELLELLTQNAFVIPEERRNEATELLRGEIPDVAVTRSNTTWGVPVDIDGFEGHTVYVWLDALLGYITNDQIAGSNNRMVMIFGKDILRFIALVWPALLMALGRPPPQQLICHGWLLNKSEKISKSKGDKVLALPPLGVSDVSRLVLMSIGAFGKDFNYCISTAKQLAAFVRDKYANLIHRVTAMMDQRGITHVEHEKREELDPFIQGLIKRWNAIQRVMQHYRIDKYVQEINEIAMEINNYITMHQIWNIASSLHFEKKSLLLCQALLTLSIYLYPIMPSISSQMIARLRPQINGNRITDDVSVKILDNLNYVAFDPQHTVRLM